MVQALIQIDDVTNRVLNIVKAKYDLKDKGKAVQFVVSKYVEETKEPEFSHEFMQKIQQAKMKELWDNEDDEAWEHV